MGYTNTLRVLLNDKAIGTLSLDKTDGCEFRLLESYKNAYPRPVLGQIFLDNLKAVHYSRARVPPWFSNLLPEGPLRELVAKQAGVHSTREFFLLHHLGEDLPGAVRVVADDAWAEPDDTEENIQPENTDDFGQWHFSLAGVQLKFSANRSERGLTIPASGRGGDWIVKLPDARFPKVPENEYATLLWAKESGIRIPEVELVDIRGISGLPEHIGLVREQWALAIRRFDRPDLNRRIHMEDFAQIFGLYPEQKYSKYNYETLGSLIYSLTGEIGLDEYIHRLIFIIISGNADAHHKNWSLIYPDGIMAELSPAYDLVSTIQYIPNDKLALNLAKSKRWEDISMDSFRRMARKLGVEERHMMAIVRVILDGIRSAWERSAKEFGYDSTAREILERHFKRIPLLESRS
ncbi:serine/threonine-protein kinase HipA [Methylomagnum ishizawai]|uniref:Serine/threonine-protein kinase HipA n=1 Tax=Methylomagnum ishizawai TaxID=1760988 RepID=A0A1Y6DA04_9GAMM|nr:type II toxin-antitoxin system HipA family toxin [Methylomagnum ishizawai]SMF97024.1 serine/threonine-protein kinase HipA [Methylomagnum ishizawai]